MPEGTAKAKSEKKISPIGFSPVPAFAFLDGDGENTDFFFAGLFDMTATTHAERRD